MGQHQFFCCLFSIFPISPYPTPLASPCNQEIPSTLCWERNCKSSLSCPMTRNKSWSDVGIWADMTGFGMVFHLPPKPVVSERVCLKNAGEQGWFGRCSGSRLVGYIPSLRIQSCQPRPISSLLAWFLLMLSAELVFPPFALLPHYRVGGWSDESCQAYVWSAFPMCVHPPMAVNWMWQTGSTSGKAYQSLQIRHHTQKAHHHPGKPPSRHARCSPTRSQSLHVASTTYCPPVCYGYSRMDIAWSNSWTGLWKGVQSDAFFLYSSISSMDMRYGISIPR